MIYGHVICQDGLPDILRTIESLYSICDEIWVLDGGSTDGTLEFLKDRATIYNLKVLKRSFDSVQGQRQFLLDQTPKNSWIVTIDQDEMISTGLKQELRHIIGDIKQSEINQEERKNPYVIKVPYFTLIQDINHYSEVDYIEIGSKIFYYDRNLLWKNPYHCEPAYPNTKVVDGKLISKLDWCIFHFAWLNPKRLKERPPDEWVRSRKWTRLLPEGVKV